MTEISKDQEMLPVMARPFSVSLSRLGTVTKLYDTKFLCNSTGVHELHAEVCERISYLNPDSGGFQFMISFEDRTHFEHQNIEELDTVLRNNGKTTERLTLKWVARHKIDGENNELTVLVRISNPVNPLLFIQAALSKSPQDIDNLEFESGSVTASIGGASQITAEDLFSVIGRWVDSRPQPQYITSLHTTISKHKEKIAFLNYWVLPVLIGVVFFLALWKHTPEQLLVPILFAAVVSNFYLRTIASRLNEKIMRWCHFSLLFSVFSLTGGDNNQQAKFASKSKNSLIKLVGVAIGSFVLNVAAGFLVTWMSGL
ncbi:MAG TPA: hypothetical protein ENJ28_04415 [Gammaproteobacteria bacterium]|nr:hypothetical protein [Gammaproteobacteria bacterium]